MTYGWEMERAYSYYGTSKICHLLTYLVTHLLAYSPGPTWGKTSSIPRVVTQMIHTHIIAHAGPTNAQMKPRSVDSQQL